MQPGPEPFSFGYVRSVRSLVSLTVAHATQPRTFHSASQWKNKMRGSLLLSQIASQGTRPNSIRLTNNGVRPEKATELFTTPYSRTRAQSRTGGGGGIGAPIICLPIRRVPPESSVRRTLGSQAFQGKFPAHARKEQPALRPTCPYIGFHHFVS
jgi:hypothetical protein